MAMAPHWLDEVIGTNKTLEGITKAINSSPAFQSLVRKAIERGCEAEEGERQGKIGANFAQTARATICRGFDQLRLNLDEV